jgi:quercetin dioxygenase-like cupin family protein
MMRDRIATSAAVMSMLCLLAAPGMAEDAKVSPIMTKDLTGLASKEGTMLMVEYAPGGSSDKHKHNAHTFVYVLEGSIVMQVEGGKEVTLSPGQTFYESPTDIHSVSKNASSTQPAKFLVFMVKEKGAPLVLPAP